MIDNDEEDFGISKGTKAENFTIPEESLFDQFLVVTTEAGKYSCNKITRSLIFEMRGVISIFLPFLKMV